MKSLSIALITFYQRYLSLDTGKIPLLFGARTPTCIYYPTCSEYTKQAISRFGFFYGIYLGMKRILRCNPSETPRVDLVPEKR